MKKCKSLSLQLMHVYLTENPLIRPQQLAGQTLAKEYHKWLQRNRQDPSAAFYLPQQPAVTADSPASLRDGCLGRVAALRRADSQEINRNMSERSLRLSLFGCQARLNCLQSRKNQRQLRTIYKELELVNHEMVYISISGDVSSRNHMAEPPLRKGVKRVVHDPQAQIVELCMSDGKTEYQTSVKYWLKAQSTDSSRVYHVSSLKPSESSVRQFINAPDKSERKHSNNLSFSTNCEDFSEPNSPTKAIPCQFEGDIRLSFEGGNKLACIELNLVALTRDTSKFFSIQELAEFELAELISDMLVK